MTERTKYLEDFFESTNFSTHKMPTESGAKKLEPGAKKPVVLDLTSFRKQAAAPAANSVSPPAPAAKAVAAVISTANAATDAAGLRSTRREHGYNESAATSTDAKGQNNEGRGSGYDPSAGAKRGADTTPPRLAPEVDEESAT